MILLSLSLLTAGCGGGPTGPPTQFTVNPSGSGSPIAVIGADPPSPRATLNPKVINFGEVPLGIPITLQVTLSNPGNASVKITSVIITSVPPSNNGFSHDLDIALKALATPETLAPGQSVLFNVTFLPIPPTGDVKASLSIVSTALDSPTILQLSGKGTQPAAGSLIANPPSIPFGDTVVLLPTAPVRVTLTNAGGTPVTINSYTPPGPDFVVTDLVTGSPPAIPPNIVLTPGQSRSFTVKFLPTAPGPPPPLPSLITFQSDAANPTTTISLSRGNAIAQDLRLSVFPAAINFVDVAPGGLPASYPVTVTNTGNFDVNITGSTVTPVGEFSVTGLATAPPLAPGASRTFTVQFQPGALGPVPKRTISLTSNATSSNSITVDGNRIPQPLGTLSFSPPIVDFGNVIDGTTPLPSQIVTLTNTGNAALTIPATPAPPAGSGFTVTGFPPVPLTLAASASRTFNVQFAPSGVPANANLSIVSTNSSNPNENIPLSGNGVLQNLQLTFNPTNLDFGPVVVGGIPADPPRPVTVTNTGNFDVIIADPNPSAPAGFTVTGLTLGSLGPGVRRPFFVQFTPALSQPFGGSISLTSNPLVSPRSMTVSGTGVSSGQLNLNPLSINFGTVVVGTPPVTRSITVINTGGAPVDVTSIVVTLGGAVFSIGNFVPGPSPPTQTLAPAPGPGNSMTFDVTFTPTAGGNSGTIRVDSNAVNPVAFVSMSGTGDPQRLTLSANLPILDFGNVQVNRPSQLLTVTLTNTGNTTVTGIAAVVTPTSDPGFSVTAAPPLTLLPGATGNFTVRFFPTSVGVGKTGGVSVTSNAATVSIGLLGNSTAAPTGNLSLSPASPPNFGSVVVGAMSPPLTVTMTNTGTGPAVTINTITTGAGFRVVTAPPLPATLTNPGDFATFTVRFEPTSPVPVPTVIVGILTVTTSANSPFVTLQGTALPQAPMLSVSPTSLPFGTVNVGSPSFLTVTVTNTGNTPVTGIAAVVTPASDQSFTVTAPPPTTLAPGISGTFTVRFFPTALTPTPANGSVSLTNTSSAPTVTINLSGTAVTPVLTLTVSPTNINFGDVLVGGSGVTATVTLLNSGASDITLTINNPTGDPGYSVPNLILPFTKVLPPGQPFSFTIRFLPTAAVISNGSVRISGNATNLPIDITLSGRGTTGIKLSWDAPNPTPGVVVVGYNVYRSTVAGGPYVRLNALGSVIPGTTYTDSTAQAGTKYFYVATAVDADGVESIFSFEFSPP